MQGTLHPSLQAYIDCIANPLIGKGWPRGGGLWDQNPVLVADFRVIRKFEREWRETQEAMSRGKSEASGGLENALDKYVSEMGESTSL